jgi:lysophospholipid acyltransferase (LPLAT)-like uncharacterized protein
MKSKIKNLCSLRWFDPIFLWIIPQLAALLIKIHMLSCRVVKVEGLERHWEALEHSDGKVIYITWHQRMSYHFHHMGPLHLTMMISNSRDGEYAARVAQWLGFRNVRGSSTRGGTAALKKMTRKVTEGEPAGVLTDGPLGPARVVKSGALFMARNTEAPLIPVLWGADRCWTLNTWDRYLIPKPFARISICYAEPIWIPPSAKGEELEDYRRQVEDIMNRATRWCDEYFGQERPWRKVKKNGTPEFGPTRNEQK